MKIKLLSFFAVVGIALLTQSTAHANAQDQSCLSANSQMTAWSGYGCSTLTWKSLNGGTDLWGSTCCSAGCINYHYIYSGGTWTCTATVYSYGNTI